MSELKLLLEDIEVSNSTLQGKGTPKMDTEWFRQAAEKEANCCVSVVSTGGLYVDIQREEIRAKDQEIKGCHKTIEKQIIQITDLVESIRRLKRGEKELDIHKML